MIRNRHEYIPDVNDCPSWLIITSNRFKTGGTSPAKKSGPRNGFKVIIYRATKGDDTKEGILGEISEHFGISEYIASKYSKIDKDYQGIKIERLGKAFQNDPMRIIE